MVRLLHEAIEAGGLGFSTTLSSTHSDGDGQPVASRHAGRDEVLALCAAVGEHEGTFLEGVVRGRPRQVQRRRDRAGGGHVRRRRPVDQLERAHRRLGRARPGAPPARGRRPRRRAEGGRVVALTMPVLVPMNMSFGTFCALWLMPGLGRRPAAAAATRSWRRSPTPRSGAGWSSASHSEEAGVFRRLAGWDRYVIGDTYSDANEGLTGRVVGDIAAERGQDAVRHAGRDRRRRRLPHRAVAHAHRQRRRRRGACARRCGTTRGSCSAARTPAPTSTACAGRRTRPGCWPTACGAASSPRSSGRCR